MLTKTLLYMCFYSKSPFSFLDFITHMYEIPKRDVDIVDGKKVKRGLKDAFDLYFAEHGLQTKPLQSVRDAYVHRITYISDIDFCLEKLHVDVVMSYVKFFDLHITEQEIEAKKAELKSLLGSMVEIYGAKDILKHDSKEERF